MLVYQLISLQSLTKGCLKPIFIITVNPLISSYTNRKLVTHLTAMSEKQTPIVKCILICDRQVYYPICGLFLKLLTFTSLLVTFQPVTVVASTSVTSVIVVAKLRASIGVFLTFVDILKTFFDAYKNENVIGYSSNNNKPRQIKAVVPRYPSLTLLLFISVFILIS